MTRPEGSDNTVQDVEASDTRLPAPAVNDAWNLDATEAPTTDARAAIDTLVPEAKIPRTPHRDVGGGWRKYL